MNKIKVQLRNVYGNELIYPMCYDAKRFTRWLDPNQTYNSHKKGGDLSMLITHIYLATIIIVLGFVYLQLIKLENMLVLMY